MKRIIAVPLVLLVSAVGLTGCATRRQVAEVSLKLDEVRRENQRMAAALARLDSLYRDENSVSRSLGAELKLSMTALEERMQLVESNLQEATVLLNRTAETVEGRSPRRVPTDTSDTTRGGMAEVDDLKLYKLAYEDVIRGNYDLAIKGFQEYLKAYPNRALADNSVYWIGEAYYIQKDYVNAQKWYEKLIAEYPNSEHLASAKLKLGMALFNQRFKTKAKQYFEDVIREFPGTDQANQAAEMLQRYDRQ